MKFKVGVIGSGLSSSHDLQTKAYDVGREIARANCILVTGSGQGLPHEAEKGAKQLDGLVVGISPAACMKEHRDKYKFPAEKSDILVFTGFGFKGRNVLFIRTCDAVILISGGIGTLNEFTIAFDEGKTIGVLKGTGGISDSIEGLVKLSRKEGGKVIYESDPKTLVGKLIRSLQSIGEG
jgi:uncharacterized protein (TIGR00725 family)